MNKKTKQDLRAEKRAAALRDNLRKRKALKKIQVGKENKSNEKE